MLILHQRRKVTMRTRTSLDIPPTLRHLPGIRRLLCFIPCHPSQPALTRLWNVTMARIQASRPLTHVHGIKPCGSRESTGPSRQLTHPSVSFCHFSRQSKLAVAVIELKYVRGDRLGNCMQQRRSSQAAMSIKDPTCCRCNLSPPRAAGYIHRTKSPKVSMNTLEKSTRARPRPCGNRSTPGDWYPTRIDRYRRKSRSVVSGGGRYPACEIPPCLIVDDRNASLRLSLVICQACQADWLYVVYSATWNVVGGLNRNNGAYHGPMSARF